MSHELRTPLNAILGFAQLLELGDLEAEDSQNVEQILRAGHHLLDLINEVLDVARVESGTLSLSIEPVDLSEIVAESLDLVRTAASGRGIVLRTPNHLDGSAVLADRQRLKQVLVNLLSNAVKYNRPDGEVVVSWARTSDRPVPGEAIEGSAAPHGWLRVAIADTGVGIPADRLDDVFTPFERLGAEGTEIEGSGVGLALTRTLVQALGGRVGVRSELGAGSTFWVDLPAVEPPAPRVPQPPTAPELCRTVLYVEDNPSNITLVRRVLARRPHVRLEIVQDGGQALAAAERLVPDLVLLDLHLPGLPGDGILAAFRGSADERLRKMPIVVVTADLTPGTERRVLEAGATFFLSKPIDVRQLLQVVDDHLPRP
jgi:CheY-like chemotaxis protein